MKRVNLVYSLLLSTLLVLAAVTWLLVLAPSRFELLVINNSSTLVDSVSLSGDAVDICEPAALKRLPAGQQQVLVCELKRQGLLRVNVTQGLNRIDHIVVHNVADMAAGGKTFTISDGNWFVLGAL